MRRAKSTPTFVSTSLVSPSLVFPNEVVEFILTAFKWNSIDIKERLLFLSF